MEKEQGFTVPRDNKSFTWLFIRKDFNIFFFCPQSILFSLFLKEEICSRIDDFCPVTSVPLGSKISTSQIQIEISESQVLIFLSIFLKMFFIQVHPFLIFLPSNVVIGRTIFNRQFRIFKDINKQNFCVLLHTVNFTKQFIICCTIQRFILIFFL